MTQRRGVRAQIRTLCSLSTPLPTSYIPAVSDGGLWMKLCHCWANLLATLDVVCCLVSLFLVLCPTPCCNFLQFSFSSFSIMFWYEEWPLRVALGLQTVLVDAERGHMTYMIQCSSSSHRALSYNQVITCDCPKPPLTMWPDRLRLSPWQNPLWLCNIVAYRATPVSAVTCCSMGVTTPWKILGVRPEFSVLPTIVPGETAGDEMFRCLG